MRALVITPFFPPIANSESFCGGKFARGLMHAGIDAKVIYCTGPGTSWSSGSDHSKFWKQLEEISLAVPNPPSGFVLSRVLLGLRYGTTSWVRWTQAVVEKATELHRQRPFDVIVSRALPWHAHLVGYWVRRALGIPWVANFNDPWDLRPFCPDPAKAKGWEVDANSEKWMRRTIAEADAVTFPCERLLNYCLKNHERRANAFAIPHIGARSDAEKTENDFLVVHAGKLGMNELTCRSTTALFEGFGEFLKSRQAARGQARLVFVGSEDPATQAEAKKLGVADSLTWAGWVSYERSLEYIAQASVCLLVEGMFEEGIFLPSKLADYLVARKPVLALSPSVGTINDLAQEKGIVRIGPKDSHGVARELVQLFDAFSAGSLSRCAPSDALVRRFEAKTVIDSFVKMVSQLPEPKAS